jgi:hypothetical protein
MMMWESKVSRRNTRRDAGRARGDYGVVPVVVVRRLFRGAPGSVGSGTEPARTPEILRARHHAGGECCADLTLRRADRGREHRGGAILRRDEGVLRIERAELLRSREEDEILVRATVKGPAEARDCYLMKGSTWFALRDAIESENVSDVPQVLMATWADPASTTRFSGGDTLAVSFKDASRKDDGPDPRDTPFFAICYKFATTGNGGATWYDVAHVEGSPKER